MSKRSKNVTEWVQADARLDKWYKDKKRRAKQHGAFSLENKTKPVYQALQGDGFKLENKG
ncbi:hypothetical protein ABVL00_14745 [Lactiplantibacillus plantarum]|nr:hypothetical protein [Lactiplantibacillus plantarum]AWI39505.1 hypothetical protein LpLQ80_02870 [Lactiplantibacillus plantarum]